MSILDFKINTRLQILLWGLILFSAVIYFIGKQIPQEELRDFIGQFGPWGPIAFILLAQIPYIIAPINGIPFLIAGYYLFGVNMIFLMYPTALLGFSINFYISRRWGRPLLSKFLDDGSLEKIDKLAKKHGVLTLIAFRIFQGGLGDYVSYAYGLTRVPFKQYFLVSALAIIPGQVVWYYFAKKTNNIEGFLAVNWVLAAAMVGTLFIGTLAINRLKRTSRS